ncbi:hypothetical protein [Sebaldella sp. S0638]|uniref:hypothetical protein n=1 Tax=Sebaldella sp. S0638 TaxID=2957809 RepID=UPI00209D42EB|nr:hypothetical protein [Sebaldella sp. S0638]MCP1224165.1 hypothetical protein [Sebaldella sp. S0638]
MKKLVMILLLFISVFSFSDEGFTENEKNTILKQFTEFQKAVKNKDVNTLKKFIDGSVYGLVLNDGPVYRLNTESVSYDEIVKYKNEFFKSMKEITLVKADLKNNEVIKYAKGEDTITGEFFIMEEDNYIWGSKGDKMFEIAASYDDPEYPSTAEYIFKMKGNQLKFISVYSMP